MSDNFVADKYKATWVSHSSISDFLVCPRGYYLRNVYKDPLTGHKVTVTSPALSLGSAVHEVVESLSVLPVEERLTTPLKEKFNVVWEKVSGKMGGFESDTQEDEFKARGVKMLERVEKHPGPILKKAVKIPSTFIPNYYLSEEDEIILCGKVDWLEYKKKDDSLNIIDFKTGKYEEKQESLQLPIYLLLVTNTQKRKVSGASYWYLNKDNKPTKQELPDEKQSFEKVYEVAKRIKLARQLQHFKCPHNGCMKCTPLERVLRGDGEKVGVSDTKQDIYILN
ncbi:PD-(D/E)XK nuclease family protein [Candidatus Microgenomates bacterium]|nr:PD-(D/E)XK nuclease family protein [Candidatus Microgenomates bacterium]